jgi:hypothetical protein
VRDHQPRKAGGYDFERKNGQGAHNWGKVDELNEGQTVDPTKESRVKLVSPDEAERVRQAMAE